MRKTIEPYNPLLTPNNQLLDPNNQLLDPNNQLLGFNNQLLEFPELSQSAPRPCQSSPGASKSSHELTQGVPEPPKVPGATPGEQSSVSSRRAPTLGHSSGSSGSTGTRHRIHRIPIIRCHHPRLAPCLPHAPVVRMTEVLHKLPQTKTRTCKAAKHCV